MKQRLVYYFKLLALVSLTTYLTRSSVLNAQNDSKAIEITDKEGKQTLLYEKSYALVIWAGNYQHSSWSKLNNVEEESKQVVNALEQRGFEVTTVGNPTGSELERAFKDFIDNYGYEPDNRLVIFFSGHGHTRNQTKGYLVPVDAQDPTSRKNEQDFLRVALPMEQIITWARLIEANHVLFVFDSCFSGTLFKQRSSTTPSKYIVDVADKPVRQFLTAGDADEKVPGKSIFTPLFIRALNGEADTINQDGYVTGNELGNYLRQNLREYNKQQTPQFGTILDPELDQGDIVFRSLNKLNFSNLLSQEPETTPDESDSKSSTTVTPPDETSRSFNKLNFLNLLSQEQETTPDESDSKSSTTVTPPDETSRSLLEPPKNPLIFNSKYNRLRNLLAEEKWKEADEETAKVMLKAAGRVYKGWLRTEDIDNFSCRDLRIIDQLWLGSSRGKFGFSVQKEIYESLVRRNEYDQWFASGGLDFGDQPAIKHDQWPAFSERVGWKKGENWLNYDELTFNLDEAPTAHLPRGYIGDHSPSDEPKGPWEEAVNKLINKVRKEESKENLFSRAKTCNL